MHSRWVKPPSSSSTHTAIRSLCVSTLQNARNRFEVCNVHVALRCLIRATMSSFGGTVQKSQTTTWHENRRKQWHFCHINWWVYQICEPSTGWYTQDNQLLLPRSLEVTLPYNTKEVGTWTGWFVSLKRWNFPGNEQHISTSSWFLKIFLVKKVPNMWWMAKLLAPCRMSTVFIYAPHMTIDWTYFFPEIMDQPLHFTWGCLHPFHGHLGYGYFPL